MCISSRFWESVNIHVSYFFCQTLYIAKRFPGQLVFVKYIFIVCGEDCRLLRAICILNEKNYVYGKRIHLRTRDKTICLQHLVNDVSACDTK